ncbi:MAG: DUF2059 domain-containing protein [Acidobacteria bacterium]|nr:DUF2059 domain-containing protein [Acidobacteriota bacterium]
MKRLALTLLLLSLACAGARGQETAEQAAAEKRQDIKRLLQLNGAGQASVQIIEQMLPSMRNVFRGLFVKLPAKSRELAVQIMEEEIRRSFTAERMVEEVIPIYDKYLTAEEVKSLIAFYESPAGRKFVAVMPFIIREGSGAGEKIAGEAIERIYKRYQEAGIPAPPPPSQRTKRGTTTRPRTD